MICYLCGTKCEDLTSWESGNEKGHGARHSEVAAQSPALGEPSPLALSSPDVDASAPWTAAAVHLALLTLWACHWVCVGCFAAVGWETMDPTPRVFTTRLTSCTAPAGRGEARGHGCRGGKVVSTKAAETKRREEADAGPADARRASRWSVRPAGQGGGRYGT